MQMDGWTDHLHIALFGEHVLFPSLRLDSPWHFIVASIFTAFLCLLERALTYAISKNWSPFVWTRRSRFARALWRSTLYWAVTFDRLLYMLVAMTFSLGLIIVTVTSLSLGQFVIEYLDSDEHDRARNDVETVKEPLLSSSPTSYEPSFALHPYPTYRSSSSRSYPYSDLSSASSLSLGNETTTPRGTTPTEPRLDQQSPIRHPRSKSKPASIFIHPAQSNIARADAAAIHMGLAGDTELVKGNMHAIEGEPSWKIGSGKDFARQLMSRSSTV